MRYASDDPSSASADVTEIESQLRDAKGQPRSRHPDQPNPIPVRVRVVWDGGSEQWIDGIARRWTRDAVFVAFADERRSTAGVWVKPSDVERR